MKFLLGLLGIVVFSFSGKAFASSPFYLCRNADNSYFMRVVPSEYRAEHVRFDKNYPMTCKDGSGSVWLTCQGQENRTFFFYVGGTSGLYVGSINNAPMTCFLANPNRT